MCKEITVKLWVVCAQFLFWAAIAQWSSSRLSIGRLGVRASATERIAVAFLNSLGIVAPHEAHWATFASTTPPKKQISDFLLPPISATKLKLIKTWYCKQTRNTDEEKSYDTWCPVVNAVCFVIKQLKLCFNVAVAKSQFEICINIVCQPNERFHMINS